MENFVLPVILVSILCRALLKTQASWSDRKVNKKPNSIQEKTSETQINFSDK